MDADTQAIIADKAYARKVEGAKQFARAQRSDPFAFARAMAHIRIGICEPYHDNRKRKMVDCNYEAKPTTVTRPLPEGVTFADGSDTYEVLEYTNMVRP